MARVWARHINGTRMGLSHLWRAYGLVTSMARVWARHIYGARMGSSHPWRAYGLVTSMACVWARHIHGSSCVALFVAGLLPLSTGFFFHLSLRAQWCRRVPTHPKTLQ